MHSKRSTLRLVVPAAVVLLVVVVILIVFITQTVRSAQEDYSQVLEEQVRNHVRELDDAISNTDAIFQASAANNVNLVGMGWGADENANMYMISKYNTWACFRQIMYRTPVTDAYFFYSPLKDDYMEVYHGDMPYAWRSTAKEANAQRIREGDVTTGWELQWVNGECLLMRVLEMQNMRMGYWVRVKKMLGSLPQAYREEFCMIRSGDGELLCCMHNDKEISAVEFDHIRAQRSKISAKSSTGEFEIVVTTRETGIWNRMSTERKLMLIGCAIALMMGVWASVICYLRVVRPMLHLVSIMKRIGQGETTLRARTGKFRIYEDALLCRSFNRMMDQLDELRARNEMQQIRLKNSEMERLKLQISPHLFINALNDISSYAMLRNTRAINDMVLYLGDYLRFVLRCNSMLVPLEKELEHTRNYIRIQQLRYADRLKYSVSVPENIMDGLVPILLVHTFVDNAVRYAMVNTEAHIQVVARRNGENIRLIIEDNGCGFSPDMMERLNHGEKIMDARGNHVGIRNLRERLDEFCGGKAQIFFANRLEGGAHVEVTIPYVRMTQEKVIECIRS